jgi:hypothetical protein
VRPLDVRARGLEVPPHLFEHHRLLSHRTSQLR